MGSEILDSRSETASVQALAPCSVLVISRDPVERQDLVLQLGSVEQVEASSAAGFHMAVPMIWASNPDAVVIGALTPADSRRLAELRQQAPGARFLHLSSAPDEYGEARPDVRLAAGASVLAALGRLLPSQQQA